MKKVLSCLVLLLTAISTTSFAQFRSGIDPEKHGHSYLKIGTQIPLMHSIIYDHRITPAFSINAGIGFITSPYTSVIFSNLENKGLVTSNERDVIERSYQVGVAWQLGANIHFEQNYLIK